MDTIWKEVILRQFTASIDMLGDALRACPSELWKAPMWNDPGMQPEFSEFWYVSYHTLFWLDLYLFGSIEGFSPPHPYTLDELDPRGLLPERVYTLVELQSYLAHCRQKCNDTIQNLTDEKVQKPCYFSWSKAGLPFAELLLDNMRHVQEHGAQLHMFLGQQAGISSKWIAQPRDDDKPD
jgi:hypothetical protein